MAVQAYDTVTAHGFYDGEATIPSKNKRKGAGTKSPSPQQHTASFPRRCMYFKLLASHPENDQMEPPAASRVEGPTRSPSTEGQV